MPEAIGPTPAPQTLAPRIPTANVAAPVPQRPTLAPIDTVVISRPTPPIPAMPVVPKAEPKRGLFQKLNDFFADPNRKVAAIALGLLGALGGGYMAWAGMAAPLVTVPLQLGCYAMMLLVGLAGKK